MYGYGYTFIPADMGMGRPIHYMDMDMVLLYLANTLPIAILIREVDKKKNLFLILHAEKIYLKMCYLLATAGAARSAARTRRTSPDGAAAARSSFSSGMGRPGRTAEARPRAVVSAQPRHFAIS